MSSVAVESGPSRPIEWTPSESRVGAFGRAVYIMWLRAMKRYVRSRAQILASLAQPLLFLLSFGFGFGAVFRQAGQGNYMQFLAPGIIGMSIVFSAVFSGMAVIWDRQFGFLKETMVAPVSRSSIMIGRTLGGATVAVLQGSIVLVVTFLVGFQPTNWLLLPAALGIMALVAIMFTAFGTAIASRLNDMQGFQLIMNFVVMPIFFLSGALFPVGGLPDAMAWIVRADPLSYGIDALRGLLNGVSHFPMALDLVVLSGVTIVFLAVGTYFFSKIEA